MRRLASALLLLPLLGAGCTATKDTFPCPGSPVATLAFTATLSLAGCAAGGPAAGVNTLYPAQVGFTGTLSSTASGDVAALCGVHPSAEPLVGTQVADQLDVSLQTSGAQLAGCNALCGVTVLQQVTGTLQRDPGGRPTGFTGTLVDQATLDGTIAGADCTPCTTPCTATYLLTGLPTTP